MEESIYKGYRQGNVSVVLKNGENVGCNEMYRFDSSAVTGFNWWEKGTSKMLSIALLSDFASGEVVTKYWQDFEGKFVANFGDNWELSSDSIIRWLMGIHALKYIGFPPDCVRYPALKSNCPICIVENCQIRESKSEVRLNNEEER